MLPMVVKAARTKDLSSYSLGNIVLSNLGNLIHSVYVFHLPAGPVWVLHTFYLVTTALMLVWYLRYQLPRRPAFTKLPRSRWLCRRRWSGRRTSSSPGLGRADRQAPTTMRDHRRPRLRLPNLGAVQSSV